MRRNICGGVLLVLVALAGCARNRDLPPMFDSSGDRPVRLTVQNNRFEDAAIYAHWRGGPKNRVGLATGATASTTFTFDWVSDIVQFEVDFIAADGYMVDPIEVSPGDHLDLVILGGK